MAVGRQLNIQGQWRLDVPHIRSIESAVAYDFDVLAGTILGGKQAYIVNGFKVKDVGGGEPVVGGGKANLRLEVAGSSVIHYNASYNGSILMVPAGTADENLDSLIPNAAGTYYIGLDFVRAPDTTTTDIVQFLNISVNPPVEVAVATPLAQTLDYTLTISGTDNFTTQGSSVCPIAIVVVDAGLLVTSITDARRMYFRLHQGGDLSYGPRSVTFTDAGDIVTLNGHNLPDDTQIFFPTITTTTGISRNVVYYVRNATLNTFQVASSAGGAALPLTTNGSGTVDIVQSFAWGSRAVENHAYFNGGDKLFTHERDWKSGVMTRLQEISGGEHWYSDTTDRNMKFYSDPADQHTRTIGGLSITDNILWNGTDVTWSGLKILLDHSTAYTNSIINQTAISAPLTTIADGEVIYVEVDRTIDGATLQMTKVTAVAFNALNPPARPGSRFIILWRKGTNVYSRLDYTPVGIYAGAATETAYGLVKISKPNAVAGGPFCIIANASDYAVADGMVTGGGVNLITFAGSDLRVGNSSGITNVLIQDGISSGTNQIVLGRYFSGTTQNINLGPNLGYTSGGVPIPGSTSNCNINIGTGAVSTTLSRIYMGSLDVSETYVLGKKVEIGISETVASTVTMGTAALNVGTTRVEGWRLRLNSTGNVTNANTITIGAVGYTDGLLNGVWLAVGNPLDSATPGSMAGFGLGGFGGPGTTAAKGGYGLAGEGGTSATGVGGTGVIGTGGAAGGIGVEGNGDTGGAGVSGQGGAGAVGVVGTGGNGAQGLKGVAGVNSAPLNLSGATSMPTGLVTGDITLQRVYDFAQSIIPPAIVQYDDGEKFFTEMWQAKSIDKGGGTYIFDDYTPFFGKISMDIGVTYEYECMVMYSKEIASATMTFGGLAIQPAYSTGIVMGQTMAGCFGSTTSYTVSGVVDVVTTNKQMAHFRVVMQNDDPTAPPNDQLYRQMGWHLQPSSGNITRYPGSWIRIRKILVGV
jgi:hypothetical protein